MNNSRSWNSNANGVTCIQLLYDGFNLGFIIIMHHHQYYLLFINWVAAAYGNESFDPVNCIYFDEAGKRNE